MLFRDLVTTGIQWICKWNTESLFVARSYLKVLSMCANYQLLAVSEQTLWCWSISHNMFYWLTEMLQNCNLVREAAGERAGFTTKRLYKGIWRGGRLKTVLQRRVWSYISVNIVAFIYYVPYSFSESWYHVTYSCFHLRRDTLDKRFKSPETVLVLRTWG